MANELTVTQVMSYAKNGIQSVVRGQGSVLVTVTGNGSVYNAGYTVTMSDIALPLGGLTTLRWAWFHNLDAVNNITIKSAVSGTRLTTLLPGEMASFPFDTSVTAPSVTSSAGTPLLEYEIFPP